MGQLLFEQYNEAGRTVVVAGIGLTGFTLFLAMYSPGVEFAPVLVCTMALTAIGAVFAKSGHRLYEGGVEKFSVLRTRQVSLQDVRSASAKRVRFLMVGIHTRTTYRVSLTMADGATFRFQHMAPAGREQPVEELLEQWGVAIANAPDRRFRG